MFNPLNKEHLALIIDIQLRRVAALLAGKGIHLEVTESAKDVLMTEGYDPAYGARPMRRAIQRLIQDPLSLRLLSGDFTPGDTVVVEGDPAKHALGVHEARGRVGDTIGGAPHAQRKYHQTVLLLGLLSGVLVMGGRALGGRNGIYIGLAFAVVMNFAGYFFSDKIALASYSAQPVTETENPEVYRRVAPIVANLTQRMGLPMPKLWLIPEESPNAFATGRNPAHASVAFTAGILQVMDDRELEGVVAHELGHVLHRDILISSVAATIAAAITALASMARWAMIFRRHAAR